MESVVDEIKSFLSTSGTLKEGDVMSKHDAKALNVLYSKSDQEQRAFLMEADSQISNNQRALEKIEALRY